MNDDPNLAMQACPDADLIERAQQGDAGAFAALFHAHKTRVYSLCLRMTNNFAEAEDLLQEAFLQVFRNLSTFRGESAFSTWLYRITVNTTLMHFRHKAPVRVSLDEAISTHDGNPPAQLQYGNRDGDLENCVTRVALARAISKLPEGSRAIFVLHEVEGYHHREIAELLGCSVGTSKSQLHKAKLRIRQLLAAPASAARGDVGTGTFGIRQLIAAVKGRNLNTEPDADALMPLAESNA